MKCLSLILALVPALAFAQESYFFSVALEGKPKQGIEGDRLIVEMPIRKIEPPQASTIRAFHQGLGPGREYQVQVHLKSNPGKGWIPMLKLADEIITEGITVTRPENERFASSFSLESSDPAKIRKWCAELKALLGVPDDRVEIDLDKATPSDGKPAE